MFTKAQRIFPQIADRLKSSEFRPAHSQRPRLFATAQRAQSRLQGHPHDGFESRGQTSAVEIQRFLRSPSTQCRTGYSSLIRGLSGQYERRFWPLEGPGYPVVLADDADVREHAFWMLVDSCAGKGPPFVWEALPTHQSPAANRYAAKRRRSVKPQPARPRRSAE